MADIEEISSVQTDFDLAKQGDRPSLDRLLERLRPQVFATCYRLIGNVDDAEDAAQEALIGIIEDIVTSPEISWQALVYRCSVSASLASLHASALLLSQQNGSPAAAVNERQGVEPLLTGKIPLYDIDAIEAYPERAVATYESLALVFVNVLQLLAPETRAVFLMKEILGASDAMTAAATNLSAEQMVQHLHFAQKTIHAAQSKLPRQPILPSHPAAAKLTRRLGKILVARDPIRLTALFDQRAALVMPPLGSFFGPEAIATQFARMFEVGLSPHATALVEVNGQPGLICYRQRRGRKGVQFYPIIIFVLMIAQNLPTDFKIARIDVITDQKVIRKVGKAVPYRKTVLPRTDSNGKHE